MLNVSNVVFLVERLTRADLSSIDDTQSQEEIKIAWETVEFLEKRLCRAAQESPCEEFFEDTTADGRVTIEDEVLASDLYDPSVRHAFGSPGTMSLERIKKIVELYERYKQRKMSWKSFQHNCRTVKHRTDIARFRRIVENNGTFKCKAADVRTHVKAMFDNARSNHLPVHEVDLRRWAIDKAEELGLRFKACST